MFPAPMLEQPHEATPYPQPNPEPSHDGSINTPNFDTDFPDLMKNGAETVIFSRKPIPGTPPAGCVVCLTSSIRSRVYEQSRK